MDRYRIIKRAHLTEKSTIAKDEANKYVFEVDRKANKIEIGDAVEKLFKVKVVKRPCPEHDWTKRSAVGRIVGQKQVLEKGLS